MTLLGLTALSVDIIQISSRYTNRIDQQGFGSSNVGIDRLRWIFIKGTCLNRRVKHYLGFIESKNLSIASLFLISATTVFILIL
jgi:hypothetical protein